MDREIILNSQNHQSVHNFLIEIIEQIDDLIRLFLKEKDLYSKLILKNMEYGKTTKFLKKNSLRYSIKHTFFREIPIPDFRVHQISFIIQVSFNQDGSFNLSEGALECSAAPYFRTNKINNVFEIPFSLQTELGRIPQFYLKALEKYFNKEFNELRDNEIKLMEYKNELITKNRDIEDILKNIISLTWGKRCSPFPSFYKEINQIIQKFGTNNTIKYLKKLQEEGEEVDDLLQILNSKLN